MDFNEWLKKHEREVFKRNQGCFDKAYIFGAKNGFKAGQQSKQAEIDKRLSDYQLEASQVGQACVKWKEVAEGRQAEIDALQKRIDDALNVFKSDLSEIGKFDTIHKILKGEQK